MFVCQIVVMIIFMGGIIILLELSELDEDGTIMIVEDFKSKYKHFKTLKNS